MIKVLLSLSFSILLLKGINLSAQVISTTPPFDYGTGVIAGNSTDGTAVVSVSGSDITVISSGSIATGNTATSGIYNFHNFKINAGVVVNVTGTSPLVIRCTGTATILGTLTAAGTAGGNTSNSVPGIAGTVVGGNGGGANGGNGGNPGVFGSNGSSVAGTLGRGLGGVPATQYGAYGGSGGCHAVVGQNGAGETNDGIPYGDSAFVTVLNGTNLLGGCGGGGGGGNSSPARAGAGGGSGGGAICITADSIVIDTAALLSVRGGNGGQMSDNNSSAGGAGGGGAGGSILLQYKSKLIGAGTPNVNPSSVVTGYTINIAGGQKGFYYLGGDGSKGFYMAQKDTSLSVGMNEKSSSGLHIYPNPVSANDLIHLIPAQKESKYSVTLADLKGIVVQSEDNVSVSAIEAGLRMPPLISPGIYFLKLATAENTYIEKIIIKD